MSYFKRKYDRRVHQRKREREWAENTTHFQCDQKKIAKCL